MKRVLFILSIVLINTVLFSCEKPEIADEIAIEVLATDGEDGEILPKEEDKD